jgi:hypothetical protein
MGKNESRVKGEGTGKEHSNTGIGLGELGKAGVEDRHEGT